MNFNSLVKDLLRYSWLAALITSASAFMLMYIFKLGNATPVWYAILVGLRFFSQGLANVLILVLIHKLIPAATVKRKKLIRYVIGYLFAFIFFFCTSPLEIYLSLPHRGAWTLAEILPSVFMQGAINNSLVIVIQNIIILRHEKTNTELENSKLKAANVESAHLLLKQQIHPHFLFNALSMLKSLYKADIHAGEAYLSHLVNFLRASLAEPQSRVSQLQDEIKLCNDYIEMQKIRFEDALNCTIDIPECVLLKGSVPSFSIQSLIENAIKHNEVTEASPLNIKVFYKDGWIITENNLQLRSQIDTPSGKGLINLIERYKILSRNEVIIRQDNDTFSVSIKVLSNEDSDHRR
jgi:hypothetical protein